MPGNPNPNIENMITAKKHQSEEKKQAVLHTLQELRSSGSLEGPVTKAAICKHARVSKAFLYNHPELLKAAEDVISKYNRSMEDNSNGWLASNNSKDKLIESLKRTIQNLRAENIELKRENGILYGKLARNSDR